MSRLLWLIPMLIKKRSWTLLVLLAVGWYVYDGQGFSMPNLDALTNVSIDQLWKEPRELLADRVIEARDVQQETVEQFKTAMEQFKRLTGFDGGELEARYEKLNDAYQLSDEQAGRISGRIERVVAAANTLLDEWREELGDYHDPNMRRLAEQQFDQTRRMAGRLIETMRAVEARTAPVLTMFRDQVLFLKHNLNARAVGSLDKEWAQIEQDVNGLIAEMQAAIDEADAFLSNLRV